MKVMEVYALLPKTNCGDCGEAACMAFALKVQTGQRRLSDCPHIKVEEDASEPDREDTRDDAYAVASDRLERQLREADFGAAAEATGGEYEPDGDVLKLVMLNRPIEVRREGLFELGAYCHSSWRKLIVYDYILRGGTTPLTGEWVPFGLFPRTPSHVKAFQKRAEADLAQAFTANLDGFRARLDALGGIPCPGEVAADLTRQLKLLPKVPLYLQVWAADDEFPASSKLFVDRSAIDYLDIEFIARLVATCVELAVAGAQNDPDSDRENVT